MSFVPNDSQQLSLDDPYYSMSDREKKFLGKSWSSYFADHIFPKINEDRFSVLYSDNSASRPGTPVNIVFGALLIKDMRNQSDDDLLESMLFDYRYQYALHTSSMESQPLSDRSLGRFRQRAYEYEQKTGIDLIQQEIESLSAEMAMMMKIDGTMKRMDSLMVAANIKKLSRLELLYTCLANLVNELADKGTKLPEDIIHYTEKEDRNKVIYHNHSDETSEKIDAVLKDCKTVLDLCGDSYDESSNYILLKRVLSEQTITNDDGSYRLRTKEDGGMTGKILQNPSDPDATFRDKAGKQNRGYVANVVESVGDKGSIVTSFDFAQNIHSDSEFAKETIEKLGKQDEKVTLVSDGAFGSTENIVLAAKNNIDLVTTNLTGKAVNDIYADFEFSEDGRSVIKCPCGYTPKTCTYNPTSEQCSITLDSKQCKNCPFKDKCKPHMGKKLARKTISLKSKMRAVQQKFRKSDEFSNLSKFRNGVETIPSYLRRGHNIDHMPVRGLIRCKQWFGLSIGGSNIKKFCKYLQSLEKCTPCTANA